MAPLSSPRSIKPSGSTLSTRSDTGCQMIIKLKSKILMYTAKFVKNAGLYALQESYKSIPATGKTKYLHLMNAVQYFLRERLTEECKIEILCAAAKKVEQDGEGLMGKHRVDHIVLASSKDQMMPNLCVICL